VFLRTFWIPRSSRGLTEKGLFWSHKMMSIMKPRLLRRGASLYDIIFVIFSVTSFRGRYINNKILKILDQN
jgi:hypothetical protein